MSILQILALNKNGAKMTTIDHPDFTVQFEETPELKEKVYQAVLDYYKKHQSYAGEVIMQNDECQINAPSVLADIADEIFKFKEISK
jgi:hypothetical protein